MAIMRHHYIPGLVCVCAILATVGLGTGAAGAETIWLSSLDLSKARVTDQIQPAIDKTIDGKPLTINKQVYARGVCVNGYTVLYVRLNGGSDKFSAVVGVDDESLVSAQPAAAAATAAGRGGAGQAAGGRAGPVAPSMSVRILADDNRVLFENNAIPSGSSVPVEVDTTGVKLLAIVVNTGGGGRGGRAGGAAATAHFDLAEARFEVSGTRPAAVEIPGEAREVLTPKPGPKPRINGPALTGVTPGRPVLYKIPATGTRPITYSVDKLPAGLKVDPATGIITGTIKDRGTYAVTLRARNSAGEARKEFKIVAEGLLSLTPALGWNSWNARGRNVTEALVRRTADAFVDKGLIDHGWTYICIDDGWERGPRQSDELYEGPTRDENGNFIPNKKFPEMKALGDFIHSKGLKFGIYSSPGPTTCQGLEASFQHEEKDVMQWCSWGVDYLKYDWCSYRAETPGLEGLKKPYQLMRALLDKAPRDIVYSICQYGNGNVWEWGAAPGIGGNSWRTTGDIRDNWPQTMQIGFNPRWSEIDIGQYGGPGHWNDVDMLVVGVVGWSYEPQHESKLSPAEQLTHISLWTLHAAPLILGCDLAQADDFTVGLLTNDEVLAIDQDPMGRGAKAVYKAANANLQVWARPLSDGSKAIGLFNLEEMPMRVTARWSDLGITGKQAVRDVWRQKDLGKFSGEFAAELPRHGCLLLRLAPAK
jgi:alpha-galactosidase